LPGTQITTTLNKRKKTKARFGRLVQLWSGNGVGAIIMAPAALIGPSVLNIMHSVSRHIVTLTINKVKECCMQCSVRTALLICLCKCRHYTKIYQLIC